MGKTDYYLDYDGTYTSDPVLFDAFIAFARQRGHSVYVVTMRHEHENDIGTKALALKVDRVFFTGRRAKQAFMSKFSFYDPQSAVWIDDNPDFILFDHERC